VLQNDPNIHTPLIRITFRIMELLIPRFRSGNQNSTPEASVGAANGAPGEEATAGTVSQ